MYQLSEQERRELTEWYWRGQGRENHLREPGRLEAFLAAAERVRDGLQQRGYFDKEWLQKFRRAGKRSAAVRNERKRGA